MDINLNIEEQAEIISEIGKTIPIAGSKGDKGDKGIQGEKGEKGLQGDIGLPPIGVAMLENLEPIQLSLTEVQNSIGDIQTALTNILGA